MHIYICFIRQNISRSDGGIIWRHRTHCHQVRPTQGLGFIAMWLIVCRLTTSLHTSLSFGWRGETLALSIIFLVSVDSRLEGKPMWVRNLFALYPMLCSAIVSWDMNSLFWGQQTLLYFDGATAWNEDLHFYFECSLSCITQAVLGMKGHGILLSHNPHTSCLS